MRVSTDPTDPAFIDDRPRRVWLNDAEITGWVVADEFRRCVITEKGVLHGGVLIERLPVIVESEPVADHVEDAIQMVDAPESIGMNFGDQSSPGDASASNSAKPVQHKHKKRR